MSHPIDEFLSAYDAYQRKDRRLAAKNVAKALGGSDETPPIMSSIDKIMDKETLIHRVCLDTVVSEVRRRERNVRRNL